MPLGRIIVLGAALLVLAGCATKSDLSSLQDDLDEMKTRTLRIDKEMAGVHEEVREGLEKNLKGFQKDIDLLRKTTADMQANLDGTKVDMQVLSGRVDELAQQSMKPADELALIKEDTTRRQTTVDGRLDKLEKGLSDLQKQLADLVNRESEKTPDAIYQRGIDAFKAGDLPKAREQFSRFIELFPNHELTANAHYWLGETYYSDKVYDQAILEIEKVIKNFPTKGKVPAALLKQGMAFKELGDTKSARFVFKKLIENYPLSDEVKLAKEKLRELK